MHAVYFHFSLSLSLIMDNFNTTPRSSKVFGNTLMLHYVPRRLFPEEDYKKELLIEPANNPSRKEKQPIKEISWAASATVPIIIMPSLM